jgi:hypothetical protein
MLALGLTLIAFAMVDLLTGGLAATPQANHWKRHVGVTFLLSLAAARSIFPSWIRSDRR